MRESPFIRVDASAAGRELSGLLRAVAAGQSVEITRDGEPIARLVAIDRPTKRILGVDKGRFVVPDDFDEPLDAW
ncbi:MAG: type II toxin-antitoxin system prevent-host-death family antitoxin [Acidimicrobiales bacterium]